MNQRTPSSSPRGFLQLDSLIFFTASDAEHGSELWVTDGTRVGTRVLDLWPGLESSAPRLGIALDDRVLFSAKNEEEGREVWVSDGTPEGTYSIDLWPGPEGSSPSDFVRYQEGAVFNTLSLMWWTDGEPGADHTHPLHFQPRNPRGSLSQAVVFNERIYFPGYMDFIAHGRELVAIDPRAQTAELFDLFPGPESSDPTQLSVAAADGREYLFFSAVHGDLGAELWVNEPDSGSPHVIDLRDGPEPSSPSNLTPHDSSDEALLFFVSVNPESGREVRALWKDDASPLGYGHRHLKDLYEGPDPEIVFEYHNRITAREDLVFFVVYGQDANEMWRSDGTVDGTIRLPLGSEVSYLTSPSLTSHAWGVLFFAYDEHRRTQIWASEGTPETTRPLPVPIEPCFTPSSLHPTSDALWLTADDPIHGEEPWLVRSPSVPPEFWMDIHRGGEALGSFPEFFTTENRAFAIFSSEIILSGSYGASLRSLDQPAGDLELLWPTDRRCESIESYVTGLGVIEDFLFFEVDHRLWRSDGSTGGTEQISEDYVWRDYQYGDGVATVDGRMLALGKRGDTMGFWLSDGSVGGTQFVSLDPAPTEFASAPVPFHDRVLFDVQIEDDVWELWSTSLDDFSVERFDLQRPHNSRFATTTIHDDLLFFVADDGVHGSELWYLCETDASPKLIDIVPGPEGSDPGELVSGSERLYFVASDNAHGSELWSMTVSDPEACQVANPTPVDLFPGEQSSNPSSLHWCENQLVFVAEHPDLGSKVWGADSTLQSIRATVDIASDSLDECVKSGHRVFFAPERDSVLIVFDCLTGRAERIDFDSEDEMGPIQEMIPAGGCVAFRTYDRLDRERFWISDGTPTGTLQPRPNLSLCLDPPTEPSPPYAYWPESDSILVRADDAENGCEAWLVRLKGDGAANFLRGDCNGDGTVDISDALFSLSSLFLGDGDPSCDDACDTNDDGTMDISDAIATLGVLFLGNGTIPLPGMDTCGVDPTEDEMGCGQYRVCP